MFSNQNIRQITLIATGLLATLSLGGGIIAILAHNWDDFPKAVRILLSFLPILLGITTYIYFERMKSGSLTWRECSAVFLMLMTGSTIGLVAQVYHMGGSFEDFLFLWLVVSIPIIYVADSSATALLHLGLSTWWLYLTYINNFNFFRFSSSGDDILWYWFLFLSVIPHWWHHHQNDRLTFRSFIFGWAIAIALCLAAPIGFSGLRYFNSIALVTMVYLTGKHFFRYGQWFWYRPLQTVAILTIAIMSLSYTVENLLEFTAERDGYITRYEDVGLGWMGDGKPEIEWTYYLNHFFLICMLIVIGMLGKKEFQSYKESFNFGILAFPLVLTLAMLLTIMGTEVWARFLINAYLLFLSWWYIRSGWNLHKGALVAWGIFVLSITLYIRYLDMEMEFWLKGLIYLGIGAGLFLMNKHYAENERV